MTEDQLRIIEVTENLYLKQGYYKTTVDEIARALKISKKTIYKNFPTKEALLKAVVESIKKKITNDHLSIIQLDLNAIEKLFLISERIAYRTKIAGVLWLKDLQTFGKGIWKDVEKFRIQFVLKNISDLIVAGKKDGLIKDIPNQILITIMLSAISAIVNPEFIINNNLSLNTAIRQTLLLLFNGMVTDKGKKILNELEENKND